MSPGEGVEVDPAVRVAATRTSRGVFATFECVPSSRPIARGHALLLPGFTGSKEDFAPLLPFVADAGWSVATYDQRGQYETAGEPDSDYSLAGFAADTEAVAAAMFGEEETVHLVGHSFGGLVAAHAVISQPSRWASLTLVCSGPSGLGEGPVYDGARLVADGVLRDGLEATYRARRERDAQRGLEPFPPAVEAFHHRRFLANRAESLAAMATLLCEAPDRTRELAALDLTVALIRGADDTWPHDVQDALADALDTRVQIIQGAAHSPAAEQPEATRDALVRSWLR